MVVSDIRADAVAQSLPADPLAVPKARRLAGEAATGLLSDEQRYKLLLAVTEVTANAVQHSESDAQIRLVMTPKDGYLCVRVTDAGLGLVPRPRATTPDEDGGFGLFLVERLTRRWGVTREDGETRVWFELDYATSADDAPVAGVAALGS